MRDPQFLPAETTAAQRSILAEDTFAKRESTAPAAKQWLTESASILYVVASPLLHRLPIPGRTTDIGFHTIVIK